MSRYVTFSCLLPASTGTVGSTPSTGINGQADRISQIYTLLFKLPGKGQNTLKCWVLIVVLRKLKICFDWLLVNDGGQLERYKV